MSFFISFLSTLGTSLITVMYSSVILYDLDATWLVITFFMLAFILSSLVKSSQKQDFYYVFVKNVMIAFMCILAYNVLSYFLGVCIEGMGETFLTPLYHGAMFTIAELRLIGVSIGIFWGIFTGLALKIR